MAKAPLVFNENDPLYRITSTVCRMVCTGLLWLVCSLPLVTVGAASCAALAEFSDPEGRSPHPLVRTFLRNLRRCFRRGTVLWLGLCALLALLALDVSFYLQFSGAAARGGQTLLILPLILSEFLIGWVRFAFFLTASGDVSPLKTQLLKAGKLALSRPAAWASILLIDLCLAVFFLNAPYFVFLLPLTPGILAWIHCGLIQGTGGRKRR